MRGTLSVFVLLALCASVFAYCGDGNCTDNETYVTCPADCQPYTSFDFSDSAPSTAGNIVTYTIPVNIPGTPTNAIMFLRYDDCGTMTINGVAVPIMNDSTCPTNPPGCPPEGPVPCGDWTTGDVTQYLHDGWNNIYLTVLDSYGVDIGYQLHLDVNFTASSCGDGFCNETIGENYTNCPADCPAPNYCGDGNCTGNETCNNCVYDCGSCCGNGICESHYGETSVTCPADCGEVLPDLTVTEITYDPIRPRHGDLVYIYAKVKNIGEATIGSQYKVTTYAGPEWTTCEHTLQYHPPGTEYTLTCNFTASGDFGYANVSVFADSAYQISETNESNNYLGTAIPVLKCDPVWYCASGTTRAYRGEDCRVTTFPCSNYFCCENGQCRKDMSNSCREIVIVKDTFNKEMAQARGIEIKGDYFFVFAMAALIGFAVYAYLKTETGREE